MNVHPKYPVSEDKEGPMLNSNPANFHVEYVDVSQHWSANSEPYAGGDCLVTALTRGWVMSPVIYVENKWYAGMRNVAIYHVELTRDDEIMVMPVLHNPWVARQISQMPYVRIYPFEDRQRREQSLD
jgi:hypothetical protein